MGGHFSSGKRKQYTKAVRVFLMDSMFSGNLLITSFAFIAAIMYTMYQIERRNNIYSIKKSLEMANPPLGRICNNSRDEFCFTKFRRCYVQESIRHYINIIYGMHVRFRGRGR